MRNKRKMIEGQERQLEKQDRLIAMIAGHDDGDDDDDDANDCDYCRT